MATEHGHPDRIGRLDLLRHDAEVTAAIEFKYPRDPTSSAAGDTMTYGKLVSDLHRLAALPASFDRYAVQLIEPRLAMHLTADSRVTAWLFERQARFRVGARGRHGPASQGSSVPTHSRRGAQLSAAVDPLVRVVWAIDE